MKMPYESMIQSIEAVVDTLRKHGHTEFNGVMGEMLVNLERYLLVLTVRMEDPTIAEPKVRMQSIEEYRASQVAMCQLESYDPVRADPETVKMRKAEQLKASIKSIRVVKGSDGKHLSQLPDRIPLDEILDGLSRLALIQLAMKFGTPCEDTDSIQMIRIQLKYKRDNVKKAKPVASSKASKKC